MLVYVHMCVYVCVYACTIASMTLHVCALECACITVGESVCISTVETNGLGDVSHVVMCLVLGTEDDVYNAIMCFV